MPSIALAGTGSGAAMLAAAARRLGWEPTAVAGDSPQRFAEETGARVVSLDELLAEPGADIVGVDTPADARGSHVVALLDAGVHVVVSPGLSVADAELVVEAEARSPASLVAAEIFPTAPAVQAWFGALQRLDEVTHLSGRAKVVEGDSSLLAVTVLSARLAGWGDPVDAMVDGHAAELRFTSSATTARLSIATDHSSSSPHWEMQAANPTNALRIEMLPTPSLEHNGEPLSVPGDNDPAETFGAAPLLRTFWADIEAGRRPVLDATFALTIERLRRQLSRAR